MASIADIKELLRRETLAPVIIALVIGASFGAWLYKAHSEYYKEDAAIARENLRKVADEAETLKKQVAELKATARPPTIKPAGGGATASLPAAFQRNESSDQVRPDTLKFIVPELVLPAKALPASSISSSQEDYARAEPLWS